MASQLVVYDWALYVSLQETQPTHCFKTVCISSQKSYGATGRGKEKPRASPPVHRHFVPREAHPISPNVFTQTLSPHKKACVCVCACETSRKARLRVLPSAFLRAKIPAGV